MQTTLPVALLIGFSSSFHCIAMCGAISGALAVSLPQKVRGNRWSLASYALAYSLGRVSSYAIAGALAGSLGRTMADALHADQGLIWLRLLAGLAVIFIGLFLAGWLPRSRRLEGFGERFWRKLEPLGRRLLPVRSLTQALAYGVVWGWLPCGLVYWALLIAAAAGNAVEGALFMVVFGLGTLPGVLATGMLAGWIQQLRSLRYVNQIAGLLLILMALAGIWYAFGAPGALSTIHHY